MPRTRSWLAAAGAAWLARGVHRAVQHTRAHDARMRAIASGPVDVDGLRALVADVVAGLPPGAVTVTESRVPERPPPGLAEHGELRLTPRAAGAIEVLVMWFEEAGEVYVFLDESSPLELTAPIDVNAGPPERPFLDVVREVLTAVAEGRADRTVDPVTGTPLGDHWPEGADRGTRAAHRRPAAWTRAAPWT